MTILAIILGMGIGGLIGLACAGLVVLMFNGMFK